MFIVTGARLEPHTPETDILKISVQLVVDGQQQFNFTSMQFELRIDEKPYKSQTYFNEFIPVGVQRNQSNSVRAPWARSLLRAAVPVGPRLGPAHEATY
jgi:hypothetical protein